MQKSREQKEKPQRRPFSRTDRNPYPRRIPPSLQRIVSPANRQREASPPQNLPSSFSSSLGASSAAAAPPPAAAPPVAAAAAPPPEPTLESMPLTSLPSRAYKAKLSVSLSLPCVLSTAQNRERVSSTLANSVAQIGSTSATFAAFRMVLILSACPRNFAVSLQTHNFWRGTGEEMGETHGDLDTVIRKDEGRV